MKTVRKIFIAINLICLILVQSFSSYAGNTLFPNGRGEFIKLGPGDTEVVVAGDSYAQYFCEFEKGKELTLHEFHHQGTTIAENHKNLMNAFDSLHRIVFFSISVNDQMRGTHPSIFEANFREMMDKAVETEKVVFIHTYMNFPLARFGNLPFTATEYDAMIRKLAQDYNNVFYIDMTAYSGDNYAMADGIHYGKEFNDAMYDKLKTAIDALRKINQGL